MLLGPVCVCVCVCVGGEANAQSVWSPSSPPPQRRTVCAHARTHTHTHTQMHTRLRAHLRAQARTSSVCHGRAWMSLGLRNAPGVFSVFFTLRAAWEPLSKPLSEPLPPSKRARGGRADTSGCAFHNKDLHGVTQTRETAMVLAGRLSRTKVLRKMLSAVSP